MHFQDRGFRRVAQKFAGHLHRLTSFWSQQLEYLANLDGGEFSKTFPEFRASLDADQPIPPASTSPLAQLALSEERAGRPEATALLLIGFIVESNPKGRLTSNQQTEEGAFFGAALSVYTASGALSELSSPAGASAAAEQTISLARHKLGDLAQEIDDIRQLKSDTRDALTILQEDLTEKNKAVIENYGRSLIAHKQNSIEQEKQRQKEFSNLVDAFNAHLRISAPVQLWENLEQRHAEASDSAWQKFKLGGIAFVIAATVLVFGLGDAVAQAFVPTTCIEGSEPSCSRISAKGPLAISAIIAVSTVWLWFLRLQMKIHLSERHLLLDARERKAFAETYLALVKGGSVTTEHEAVVLQSLFRPTQDGIIKDDGGIDVGVAGLLSRALSKNN